MTGIDREAVERFTDAASVSSSVRDNFKATATELEALLEQQREAVFFDASRAAHIARLEARLEELLDEHKRAVAPSRREVLLEMARREKRRREARNDLVAFAEHINPLYDANWHHRRLAAALEAWVRGDIKRLIVCMPPRHGKSELVSRLLPAWILGKMPDAEVIAATHTAGFAKDLSLDVQAIMDSSAYGDVFPETRLYSANARPVLGGRVTLRRANEFRIVDHQGRYFATGVDGALVGRGMKFGIIDDPVKGWRDAKSEANREALVEWYRREFFTRRSHDARILVTATRWTLGDLIGVLLDEEKSGVGERWTKVIFPAIREDLDDADDPRAIGEPLWPNRFPVEFLRPAMAIASSWNSLYQQRPTPDAGQIFKREWMRHRWREMPADLDEIVISVDCAFKKSKDGSAVSMQVWGRRGAAEFYLLDEVCDRMSFVDTKKAFVDLCGKWPEARTKLIEEAANGFAIIDEFSRGAARRKIPGIVPVKTRGASKESRAEASTPFFAAGNVYLPDAAAKMRGGRAPTWVSDWIEELVAFPSGKRNDRVDSCSQALNHFAAKRSTTLQIGRA